MLHQTLLGLFDGYMSRRDDQLTSETKLGGSPTYLPLLSTEQQGLIDRWTSCGVCGHPMFLLLQAYSPLPGGTGEVGSAVASPAPPTSSPHRMLYVFCCNSSGCARQPSASWAAFSLQVDHDDDEESPRAAEEEVVATGPLLPSELAPNSLPPCFIRVVEEPAEAEGVVPTDLELEMIRMAEANSRAAEANHGVEFPDEDLKELAKVVDLKDKRSDYYYEKFRTQIARAPTQVLRYHQRTPLPLPPSNKPKEASGGMPAQQAKHERPLFMNPQKLKLKQSTIPACSFCGASLAYELQVMPTSLYYLRVHEYVNHASHKSGDEGVDFGTATVYTCSKDCSLLQKGVHLRREVVVVEEAPQLNDDNLFDEAPAGEGAAGSPGPWINLRNTMVGQ
ncbi:unnamed protein product [Phytomonas sp. EM1]|nr:unnamed protein product [Phytomonas sp. EM1]|eukprot:CCW62977.1 unnamed protein product [Phytomonas sp. isolate EM1]